MFHLHFFVFVLVFVACRAQDAFTCTRTNQPFDQISILQDELSNIRQQLSSFQVSFTNELNRLHQQLRLIQEEIEIEEWKEENITSNLLRGYANLDDDWIAPFNGYQYKITPNNQSWDESRGFCKSWGGDLIAHGVQDPIVRSAIIRGLSLDNGQQVWIGLTDRESQGHFVWVNGERAPTWDGSLWHPGQPNGGDCCSTLLGMAQIRSFDERCSYEGFPAICERPI